MEVGVYALALISPLLYAATNHIDKILLQEYFQDGGVGTLILFSALLSILALPVLFLIDPTVLEVERGSILVLALVGCMNVLLLWCYLQAMFHDEPTVVIIFYQIVPVIALVLGYFFLGETIDTSQILAMIAIISGALLLIVAFDNRGRLEFKFRTVFYMLVASSCWATESVLFKVVALEENIWRALFWEHVALVCIGIGIFFIVPKYRRSFAAAWTDNSLPVFGLNGLNESLYILGNSIAAYVVMLVPVSLTLLMNSFQPLFVLVLGLVIYWLVPSLKVQEVSRRNLLQKLAAILMTSLGAYQLGEW